jgi:hypothetical protein
MFWCGIDLDFGQITTPQDARLCLYPERTSTSCLALLLLSFGPRSPEDCRAISNWTMLGTSILDVPWRKSAVLLRILEWMKALEALMW